MTKIRIRQAQRQDCEALLLLIREHAEFERSNATIDMGELSRIISALMPPVQIFVADCDGDLAGFAAMTTDYALWRGHQWAHLDCLYVSAERRSSGIGSLLFHHAVAASGNLGADRLEWQTPDWNERAIKFYLSEGGVASKKMRFMMELNGNRERTFS